MYRSPSDAPRVLPAPVCETDESSRQSTDRLTKGGAQLIRRIPARVILHGGRRGCQCILCANETTAERRELVAHLATVSGLPVQRACQAVGLGRATYYLSVGGQLSPARWPGH
jgi:hypothetical protein